MESEPEIIRCEMCDTEVEFQSYSDHLEICHSRSLSFIVIPLVDRPTQRARFDPLHIYEMMLWYNNNYDLDDYEANLFLQDLVGNVCVSIKDIDTVSAIEDCVDCDKMCPICLEAFSEEVAVRKTVCGHVFCEGCLKEWLSKSVKCPCCMQDMRTLIKSC